MSLVSDLKNEAKELLSPIETKLFLFITLDFLLLEYFGWQGPFYRIVAPILKNSNFLFEPKFMAQVYTTTSFGVLFILFPIIFLSATGKWRDLPKGFLFPKFKDWLPYLAIAAFMFTVLAIVCKDPSFYRFYPLYRPQSWASWLKFELVYMPQFLAVEFFFRGPLLYFMKEKFSSGAEMMITLPYALIHIHKPFAEALGSIIAGVILCRLSLKTKSILPGVLIHMFVALSADFFGLYYSGTLSRF